MALRPSTISRCILVAAFLAAALPLEATEPLHEARSPAAVGWDTSFAWAQADVTVAGPSGTISWTIPAGDPLRIEVADLVEHARRAGLEPDGLYRYEIVLVPTLDEATRALMARAREAGDDEAVEQLRARGVLPRERVAASGHFRLDGGLIVVDQGETERPSANQARPAAAERASGAAPTEPPSATTQGIADGTTRDSLIYDDLIVTGSECIGFDCVNGESFGFDTLKLKENNLRIKFEDTSVGTFPTVDWQIVVNDTTSGGASYFAINDVTNSRTPFKVEANAPSNSLYVEDYGRVGLGTSIPYVELHIVDGDTPTVRLDQDGSSGWAAQRWDMAGNETNFFIRDVTNGSKLPFRIFPGADSNSLVIASSGKVGFGTSSPDSVVDIRSSDTADRGYLHVVNSSMDDTSRIMLFLENYGNVVYRLRNTQSGAEWANVMGGSGYVFNNVNNPGNEFRIANNGDVYVNNVMVHSSRTLKTDFRELDPQAVLDRVLALPITRWRYKVDDTGRYHIGPVAEDFQAVFGLTADTETIGVSDLSGVALASIQALNTMIERRDAEISRLERENSELQQRLTTIEESIRQLQSSAH